MSWDGQERAAAQQQIARSKALGVGPLHPLEETVDGCLDALTAMEAALRDAEAMDTCQPTSGGEADTYETIKARRRAVLTRYRLPQGTK